MENFDILHIKQQATNAINELISVSALQKGDLIVVGGSSSTVVGGIIGKNSNLEAAQAIVCAFKLACDNAGVFMAVQCCEHLNRALVVERSYAKANRLEIVDVSPAPNAGGAFATVAKNLCSDFVCVEFIKAQSGIDVGNTFIGMHLRHVAVPIVPKQNKIGNANVTMARTRNKYIGGPRALYS